VLDSATTLMKTAPAKCCPSCGERYDADVLFCPRDGTPLVSSRSPSFPGIVAERDPYLGLELAGQIQIKSLIGIGSMGRVYRAFQAGIDRDVAVKILHRELSGNAELVGRFHREARVASRLVHANVVQVLMTGNLPAQPDPRVGGELYLVMEHLDGISLLSALAAAGAGSDGAAPALPLPRALHITLQICDAVGEAHAQGIVHRDLKPENVMLVRRGEDVDYVKVLDFGIARLTWIDRSMATQAGLIFGTAKYISPEGAEGHPVGPAADVYSIATMLYQCLAGRTPFEGDSHVTLLMHHAHTPPPPLTSIPRASYVPGPIASVIMQNLSKKPGDRAPDARAFGRDIITAARESGLFPEDIVPQSALLLSARPGSVKLASKERTKALELSADLASKIGGVPARSSEPPAEETAKSDRASEAGGVDAAAADAAFAAAAPKAAGTDPLSKSSPSHKAPQSGDALSKSSPSHKPIQVGDPLSKSSPSHRAPHAGDLLSQSSPSQRLSGSSPTLIDLDPPDSSVTQPPDRASARPAESGARSSATPVTTSTSAFKTQIDLGPEADIAHLAGAPLPSTIQGTETSLQPDDAPDRPSRPRRSKLPAILACAALAAAVAVIGGARMGILGPASGRDSIEAHLDEARDCIRRHAWNTPAEPNVKDITDRALARWPSDPRVQEVRREAAERLVADALGRKYAGDIEGALRLSNLALELHPTLTTAQHLAAELQGGRARPATPASTDSGAVEKQQPKVVPRKGARDGAGGGGAKGGAGASIPTPRSDTTTPGPALPPPTAPPLSTQAPPASTGPWL
jgi:serine/threonine protein kinase